MPPEAMFAPADLCAAAARRYPEHEWERGNAWTSMFGCLMRHAWKWMRGEECDDETGWHHITRVAWNTLALIAYSKRKAGADDRAAETSP